MIESLLQRKKKYSELWSERAAGEKIFQRKTRSKRAAGENFSKNENFIRENQ